MSVSYPTADVFTGRSWYKVLIKRGIIAVITSAVVLSGVGVWQNVTKADEITVKYEGEAVEFDVPAQIINDTTMVPMRTLFELFGYKVKWDQETQTVTARKNSKTITMTVGSTEITLTKSSGETETVTCSYAPVVVDGRTLIPLRAVSELAGLDVEWDQETKTASISDNSEEDDSWKDNTAEIDLDAGTSTGSGVSFDGGTVTVTEGGDYTVKGTLSDGCIVVNSEDKVKLRLSGTDITNSSGPAIYIESADKAYITLSSGTVNTLTDGTEYSGDYAELDGCIVAKDTLEIKGGGELTINSETHRGIKASDSLKIEEGIISITSAEDAIKVNDTFSMSGGTLNIETERDGIASESIVDITGGEINITTTGEVESSVQEDQMMGGGRGMRQPGAQPEASAQPESTARPETAAETEEAASADGSDISSKGIKAEWLMDILGGIVNITSTDHALKCTSDINISGSAELTLDSSINKGIKAEGDITIDGGKIDITQSTEGIESKRFLTINDGEIHITASDDGLNAGGQDMNDMPGGMGGGMTPPEMNDAGDGTQMQHPQRPEGGTMPDGTEQDTGEMQPPQDMRQGEPPAMPDGAEQSSDGTAPEAPQDGEAPVRGGMPGGGRGNGGMGGGMMENTESTEKSESHHIQINGGYLYINAQGDGIDSNGSLFIDGGTVIVDGPENSGNGAIDAQGALMCGGGVVITAGGAGMAQSFNSSSEQNSLSIYTGETQEAGTVIRVEDEDGTDVVTYSPSKAYGHVLISSPLIETGKTYRIYLGGTCTGESTDGLYSSGDYSGGTLLEEVAITEVCTVAGEQSGFGRFGR